MRKRRLQKKDVARAYEVLEADSAGVDVTSGSRGIVTTGSVRVLPNQTIGGAPRIRCCDWTLETG